MLLLRQLNQIGMIWRRLGRKFSRDEGRHLVRTSPEVDPEKMRMYYDGSGEFVYWVTLSPYEPASGPVDPQVHAVVFEHQRWGFIGSAPLPAWMTLSGMDYETLTDLFEEAIRP